MNVFGEYPLLIAALAGVTLLAGCTQASRPVSSPRAPTMDVSIVVDVEIYDPEESPADEAMPVLADIPSIVGPPAISQAPIEREQPADAEAPDNPVFGERNRVFFGFDSAALQDDQRAMLHEWTHWLAEHPGWGLRIEGHTDDQGACLYNRRLGQQRADTARDLLVAQGIDASRLRAVSFGEDRPIIPGASRAQRVENRRVLAEAMPLADLESYDPGLPPCASTDTAHASPGKTAQAAEPAASFAESN